ATGHALASTFEKVAPATRRASGGVHDESIGVHDESIGVHDESIGVHDESIGVHDESIGVHDESIGAGRGAGGVHDESIGGLGPEEPAGVKATIVHHLVGSADFGKLTAAEQADFVKVMASGGERGMRMMASLFESRPKALREAASDGSSLLSNLAKIASQPLN